MGIALALIFIVAAAIAVDVIRKNTKAEWADQLEVLTLIIAEQASQTLFSAGTTLDSISDVVRLENFSDEKSYRNFASKKQQYTLLAEKIKGNPIIDVATFVANDGTVLNFSRSFPPPEINLSNRDYFQWFLTHDSKDIFYSEPVKNKGNGKWVFYISKRVSNNHGEFLGIILVGISSEVFSNFYERIGSNLGSRASLSLYRDDYILMTRWPFVGELIGLKNTTSTANTILKYMNPVHGVIETDSARFTTGSSKDRRMVAARAVENYPFVVAAVVQEEIYAPIWYKSIGWILASLVFGIMLIGTSVAFLLRANKKIGIELDERIAAQDALGAAHEALKEVAYKDPLTGLPNHQKFIEALAIVIEERKLNSTYCAVIYIDLANFKELNSRFGHDRGDLILKELSYQIQAYVGENDLVARFGGAEFVLLLHNLSKQRSKALEIVDRICEQTLGKISEFHHFNGVEFRGSARIGVALFNSPEFRVDELMKQAGIAVQQSKGLGANVISIFDPEMQKIIDDEEKLVEELKKAISENILELYFQPQFDRDLNIIGAEALLRWNAPDVGNIPPNICIPLAEKNGLIHLLGDWVLGSVSNQLLAWSKLNLMNDLVLSINISAQQFMLENFVSSVLSPLKSKGVQSNRLKLELTESVFISNFDDAIQKMKEIKLSGVQLALDDFGTGYSSLSYLKNLPLDQLKIDKSFIHDVLIDDNDVAIVKTIVMLGKSLGLDVIAEGVETMEQYHFLRSINCNLYQGYLICQPLPATEFISFVQAYRQKSS